MPWILDVFSSNTTNATDFSMPPAPARWCITHFTRASTPLTPPMLTHHPNTPPTLARCPCKEVNHASANSTSFPKVIIKTRLWSGNMIWKHLTRAHGWGWGRHGRGILTLETNGQRVCATQVFENFLKN